MIRAALHWGVICGVARRAWARNENSLTGGLEFNRQHREAGQITLPYRVREELIDGLLR